jgi:SP family general alpha glucoside:H+ symporter-like MFS transporter
VLLFGILCSFYLVERAGRRPLVLFGSTACGICVICIGALGTITSQSGSVGSALIALSCVWVYSYALSLAPIGMSALVSGRTTSED